jgi:hypothetical protein
MTMGSIRRILQAQHDALERGVLSLWTVYDHPNDFPDCCFVARRWEVGKDKSGLPRATNETIIANDLEALRHIFTRAGLHRLPRHDDDDAKIVETWL